VLSYQLSKATAPRRSLAPRLSAKGAILLIGVLSLALWSAIVVLLFQLL